MKYANFIKTVLLEAGEIAKKSFGKVTGTIKPEDPSQVLTETDLEISKFITEKISRTYPEHNIIDEESGAVDKNSEFTWVVDPIDGTANFAQGIPMYGIMLGLLKTETPIAGGIYLPEFSELYFAEKGGGAYCNGEKVRVSQEKDLSNCLVSYGIDGLVKNPQQTFDESRLLVDIILHIQNFRTSNSCYDFTLVASGKYGADMNRTSKIWDNVAAHVIIQEAGGIYTNFWGEQIDYSDPLAKIKQNFTFCCGAPAIHRQLQKIIHEFKTAKNV